MRRAVVAALTVGFAGCADPAQPFQQRLYVNQPATGQYRLNGPGYEMTFGRSLMGLQLPTSFRIGDADEAFAQGGACANEGLAGISVYPATRAIGGGMGESTLRITQEGPAVVQIAIDFDVPYTCDGTSQHLIGTTTYTYFPSSRIVRHDAISQSSTAMLSSSIGCGCSNFSSDFFFTSYWTFATERFVNVSGVPVTSGPAPRVCARVGNNLLALAWSDGSTRIANNPDPAAVYDFAVSQMLPRSEASITSAVSIGYNLTEAECADAHANLADPQLIVDGAPILTDEHGIFVDARVHSGGQFEIRAEDGDVPPFAIILDIGGATHARVSRSEGAYAIQAVPNSTALLFYFDDGLGMSDSILITPY